MNNKVIYTCRTGGYDSLLQPLVVDPTFDYICFVDKAKKKKEGIWDIVEIPIKIDDQVILSRYPKMHPHLLLRNYDYSIYIDANILIQTEMFYKNVNNAIDKSFILAGIKHPYIKSTYDEFFNVLKYHKECNIFHLKKQYNFLKDNHFPENFGMYEANIVLRKNNDPLIIKQCEEWWYLFNRFTKRDQLSYSYTIWHNGIEMNYLMKACGKKANASDPYMVISHSSNKSIIWYLWGRLFNSKLEKTIKKIFTCFLNI